MRKLLPVVRHRLPCPLPRSLGPCFCVSIKKQWWDLQDFESPPTIVPLIQGFAHELPSHPVYHLGLNEKVRYDELRWASWLQSNLSWKNSLKPLFEPERSPKWSIKMLPENTIRQKAALKTYFLSRLHKPIWSRFKLPYQKSFFIHLYPSAIFEVFFWWWNPKFAETPRNSTERLCRIPPTDQPSFKPFTKRIRDVDRAKLVESKPQSCAKVVGCGVTLKRCQQCRWSHSDVHG